MSRKSCITPCRTNHVTYFTFARWHYYRPQRPSISNLVKEIRRSFLSNPDGYVLRIVDHGGRIEAKDAPVHDPAVHQDFDL